MHDYFNVFESDGKSFFWRAIYRAAAYDNWSNLAAQPASRFPCDAPGTNCFYARRFQPVWSSDPVSSTGRLIVISD